MVKILMMGAAMAYGITALVLITVAAIWLGNALAVKLMVLCMAAAYVCQVLAAFVADGQVDGTVAFIAWGVSVFFGVAAIIALVAA